MSTVNFYDVLDVAQDATSKDIKSSYRDLVLIFHPDKSTGDVEMFELITTAYNILINKNSRKEYDELYSISKQSESNHFDLKIKSKDHFSALDNDISKTKKSDMDQKQEFKKIMDEMDRKHGYKREKMAIDPLKEKKTTKRLSDLQLAREHDDIENIHENLFEGGRFEISKFNAAFDAMHKGHTELIPHNGNPLAYNMDSGFSNFSSLDSYDDLYVDLYVEDDILGSSNFGSIKLNHEQKKKLGRGDLDKLGSADYTKNHNYKDKDYNKSLEDKIREREFFTKKLDDRVIDDFDNDDNMGGYGISDKIGLKASSIEWDNGEDIKTRYNRLLELRKQA